MQDVDDIRGHPNSVSQLEFAISTFTDMPPESSLQPVTPEDIKQIPCDVCGKHFASLTSVRKHKAISHKIKDRQTRTFDVSEHADGDLPTCRFCKHPFGAWEGLRMHIVRDRRAKAPWRVEAQATPPGSQTLPKSGHVMLPVVADSNAAQENRTGQTESAQGSGTTQGVVPPPLKDTEVLQMVRNEGWQAIPSSKHAARLKQHCVVCSRWIVDPTALKRHLKQAHKDVSLVCEKRSDSCV